jgi:hypothetical protein
MKTNFKRSKKVEYPSDHVIPKSGNKKNFTQEEFEEFIIKSGAVGSYMIFRSEKKEDEMGLEQL